MDIATIDDNYDKLTNQSQQTIQALTTLAQKLQAAADKGDTNAREWMLDLKEIAIGVRDEQSQVTSLLQSIHAFAANAASEPAPQQQVQQQAPAPQYQQPAPPPPQYQQPYPQPQYAPQGYGYGGGGGMMHRFLGSGFGSAIASGAGFGIGDELIQNLFN